MIKMKKIFIILPLLFTLISISCTKEWDNTITAPHYAGNILVHVVSPLPNSIVMDQITAEFQIYDDDDNIRKVEFILDNELLKTWQRPPYKITLAPAYADSTYHTISVKVFDNENVVESSFSFLYRQSIALNIPVLRFNSLGNENVSLIWNDDWSGITKFIVEEKIFRSSSDTTAYTVLAELPGTQTSHLITGLDTLYQYSFRVKAVNDSEEFPYSNEIKVQYQTKQMQVKSEFGDHAFEIAYLKKSDRIISIHNSTNLIMWDALGTKYLEFVNEAVCKAFAVSPDEKMVASVGSGVIKIWNTSNGSLIRRIVTGSKNEQMLTFANNNRYIVSVSEKVVKIWDIESGLLNLQFSNETFVFSIAVSRDDTEIITCSIGAIKFWNSLNGQLRKTITSDFNFSTIEISSKGSEFATAGRHLLIWNYPQGTIKNSLNLGDEVYLNYNSDCSKIHTSGNGLVEIWDVNSSSKINRFYLNPYLTNAVFGADDETIITAGGMIRVWEFGSRWVLTE
jgi:hypothetical protein